MKCSVVVVGLLLCLALSGCGVKGEPVPPLQAQPERITDLSAGVEKDGIRLSWARPSRYAGGHTMSDLAGFIVMRAEADGSFQKVLEEPITDRERFRKILRLDWLDTSTEMNHTYRYEVISVTDDGYRSSPSNVAEITRVVPKAPAALPSFAPPTPTPAQ
jgi:hypothetical protein